MLRRTTDMQVSDTIPVVEAGQLPDNSYFETLRAKGKPVKLLQDGTQWTLVQFFPEVMKIRALRIKICNSSQETVLLLPIVHIFMIIELSNKIWYVRMAICMNWKMYCCHQKIWQDIYENLVTCDNSIICWSVSVFRIFMARRNKGIQFMN